MEDRHICALCSEEAVFVKSAGFTGWDHVNTNYRHPVNHVNVTDAAKQKLAEANVHSVEELIAFWEALARQTETPDKVRIVFWLMVEQLKVILEEERK